MGEPARPAFRLPPPVLCSAFPWCWSVKLWRRRDRNMAARPEGIGRSRPCGRTGFRWGRPAGRAARDRRSGRMRRTCAGSPHRRESRAFARSVTAPWVCGWSTGEGHFADPQTSLRALTPSGRAGSSSRRPPGRHPGHSRASKTVPYLTDETILDLAAIPQPPSGLGAGPEALWVAQAYRRLGARVTLIAPRRRALPDEDPEIAAIVERSLRQEGIHFGLGVRDPRRNAER